MYRLGIIEESIDDKNVLCDLTGSVSDPFFLYTFLRFS